MNLLRQTQQDSLALSLSFDCSRLIFDHRTGVNELDLWGEQKPLTKIVAIGSPGEIDPDLSTARFESSLRETEYS